MGWKKWKDVSCVTSGKSSTSLNLIICFPKTCSQGHVSSAWSWTHPILFPSSSGGQCVWALRLCPMALGSGTVKLRLGVFCPGSRLAKGRWIWAAPSGFPPPPWGWDGGTEAAKVHLHSSCAAGLSALPSLLQRGALAPDRGSWVGVSVTQPGFKSHQTVCKPEPKKGPPHSGE